jgi:hypothetical protein
VLKKIVLGIGLLPIGLVLGIAQDGSVGDYKQLNRAVKDRYDGKVLLVARDGLIAGEYQKNMLGGGTPGMSYHYFHESVSDLPKHVSTGQIVARPLAQMNRVDDRTFNDVTSGLNITKLTKGEQVRVTKFYMRGNDVELFLEPLGPEHLKDLDVNKASKRSTTLVGGGQARQDVSVAGFGVRFLFYFDKDKVLDNGDLKTVEGTINKFFIPATEAEKAQAAEKNVEIEIGDSEDVVIKKLGEPVKSVRVGSQKILKFKDLTVILKDGKVADVKIE